MSDTPILTDKLRTVAEFMEWAHIKEYDKYVDPSDRYKTHVSVENMKFDKSWDSIHPVWEKFRAEQQANMMACGLIQKITDALLYGTVYETFNLLYEGIQRFKPDKK